MKDLRIRSVAANGTSPWVYLQEKRKEAAPVFQPFKVSALAVQKKRGRTNQYGRFRYSEYQYGRLEAVMASSLEISKNPMRIKNADGEWVYFGQTEIPGACPAIRVRSRNQNETGPWVYIQHQEV